VNAINTELLSVDLLGEILDLKITDYKYSSYYYNIVFETPSFGGFGGKINIWELLHRCKEWLNKKGFGVEVRYYNDVCVTVTLFDIYWSPPKKETYIFDGEKEVGVMIAACEAVYSKKVESNVSKN
jgi:hypothetical protein